MPMSSDTLSYWMRVTQLSFDEKATSVRKATSRVTKLPCGKSMSLNS